MLVRSVDLEREARENVDVNKRCGVGPAASTVGDYLPDWISGEGAPEDPLLRHGGTGLRGRGRDITALAVLSPC